MGLACNSMFSVGEEKALESIPEDVGLLDVWEELMGWRWKDLGVVEVACKAVFVTFAEGTDGRGVW